MMAMVRLTPSSLLLVFTVLVVFASVAGEGQNHKEYDLCQGNESITVRLKPASKLFYIDSIRTPSVTGGMRKCSLVLESGSRPLILEFRFTGLYLESSDNCEYSYICIHGAKLCGDPMMIGKSMYTILPANRKSTIVIQADFRVDYPLFMIDVHVTRAKKHMMFTETRGVGSSPEHLYWKNVTFTPWMPYNDVCSPFISTTTVPLIIHTPTQQVYNLCDPAGSNIVKLNSARPSFIIRSPKFGFDGYPEPSKCSLVLESGYQPLVVTFHYKEFNLKYEATCSNNYLCVHGVKFCGGWLTEYRIPNILPPVSKSTVVFITDWEESRSSFEVIVTVHPADVRKSIFEPRGVGSSERVIDYERVMYSPGMPYQDNCPDPTWTYTKTKRPRIYTMCGELTSKFVRLTASSSPFIIHSPNYRLGTYTANSNCTLVLTAGPEPLVISFRYSVFNVEIDNDCVCAYDSFCVHGAVMCGYWLPGRVLQNILPAHRTLTIRFTSDKSNEYEGFEIHVSVERAVMKKTVQEIEGVGCLAGKMYRVDVKYSPRMQYNDTC